MYLPSTVLEQIRAEPLTNYCAWNEPNVPVRPVTSSLARRRPRGRWPVVAALLAALAALWLSATAWQEAAFDAGDRGVAGTDGGADTRGASVIKI